MRVRRRFRAANSHSARFNFRGACHIGFTGTPIEEADANTLETFGGYVSIYDIEDAKEDKATVPIYYESRLAKLDINRDEIDALNKDDRVCFRHGSTRATRCRMRYWAGELGGRGSGSAFQDGLMYFLVYVSSAIAAFSKTELLQVMSKSAANNARLGLTGMLLHKDGNFMQALEGEEADVWALYYKIGEDRRHRGLLTLLHGRLSERQFLEWSMAFRDLNSPEMVAQPGYSEFMNSPLTGAEFGGEPSRCQRLLTTFKKSM